MLDKNKLNLFIGLSYKIAMFISVCILGILSLISLRSRGYFYMYSWEEMTFFENNWKFFVLLLLLFISFGICYRIIKNISNYLLFIALSSFFLFIGTYVSINAGEMLRADPNYLFLAAIEMNGGDYSSFDKISSVNYMSTFPNQMGLLTLFRIYAHFTRDTNYLFLLQVFMVSGINFVLWRITDIIFENKIINNIVILLSHLFLPTIFLTLWIYGDIPGLLCSLIAIYLYLNFEKNLKWLNSIAIVIFMTLGCILRSNYLIIFIALSIIIFLSFLRKRDYKKVFIIFSIPLLFIGLNTVIESYYESKINADITYPPQKAWIVMGLNDKINNPGYWDSYTTEIRVRNNYDDNKVKKVVNDDLKERIEVLKSDKNYAKNFFVKKLMVTWNDPTFQSIFAGPLAARGQNIETSILKDLYGEGKLYHLYNKYLSVLLTFIYLSSFIMALVLLFSKIDDNKLFTLLFFIYLIGGFIFHLFWETKSRYVFPYVYLLIPVVANLIYYYSNKLFYHKKY